MPIQSFEPKFMKIGVLTAALQELTPREKRDPDPDLAIEEWVQFASELGVDNIQLSAALHPSESDVPAEAMLDPVANTLDLRQPFNRERAFLASFFPGAAARPLAEKATLQFSDALCTRPGAPEKYRRATRTLR